MLAAFVFGSAADEHSSPLVKTAAAIHSRLRVVPLITKIPPLTIVKIPGDAESTAGANGLVVALFVQLIEH